MIVEERRGLLGALRMLLLRVFWYVHPAVVLVFAVSPAVCLQTLLLAAKPSTRRLHLRDLFAGGRRYDVRPRESSFTITTTHSVRWRYRVRTGGVTLMFGALDTPGAELTRVRLRVRIRLLYLLDVFLVPTFVASIIVFMDWAAWLIVLLVAALYTLSWLGHYYNARLEANELVFFVQKALEDYVPQAAPALGAQSPGVTYDRDFAQVWQRYYEEQVGEEAASEQQPPHA